MYAHMLDNQNDEKKRVKVQNNSHKNQMWIWSRQLVSLINQIIQEQKGNEDILLEQYEAAMTTVK